MPRWAGRWAHTADRYEGRRARGRTRLAGQGGSGCRFGRRQFPSAVARDLINLPSSDMGPAELAGAARKLAREFKASSASSSATCRKKNYPMVHAVGRASDRAPRLIDIRWGKPSDPKVTIVGKGLFLTAAALT